MKFKRFGALLLSAVLCIGIAAPAFAYEGDTTPVEQPVLPEVVEEDTVTITDEESGALTPEGNLTLVDDYHTNYSDGSGQQFITLVSKSGATFYLVMPTLKLPDLKPLTAATSMTLLWVMFPLASIKSTTRRTTNRVSASTTISSPRPSTKYVRAAS